MWLVDLPCRANFKNPGENTVFCSLLCRMTRGGGTMERSCERRHMLNFYLLIMLFSSTFLSSSGSTSLVKIWNSNRGLNVWVSFYVLFYFVLSRNVKVFVTHFQLGNATSRIKSCPQLVYQNMSLSVLEAPGCQYRHGILEFENWYLWLCILLQIIDDNPSIAMYCM